MLETPDPGAWRPCHSRTTACVRQVEGLLIEGHQFGRMAVEWEKVKTYWHIGDAWWHFLEDQGGVCSTVSRPYVTSVKT